MQFTSLYYFVFLATACAAVHLTLRRPLPQRTLILVLLSFLYFATFSLPMVILLALTSGFNFFASGALGRPGHRKIYFYGALLFNLAPLVVLKFLPAGVPDTFSGRLSLEIPVGVSFFTFKSISYLVEVRRGTFKAASALDLALYLSFFPAILCGPISRFDDFQSHRFLSLRLEDVENSLILIIKGLFKKLFVADGIHYFLRSWSLADDPGVACSILTMAALSVQIYADFSGYTDVARGSGRLLGFPLPENFRRSLLAVNIAEFWRNHHITLSNWFRDYVYLPMLRLSFFSPGLRVIAGIAVTFMLSALWHGLFPGAWIFGGVQIGFFFALICYRKYRAKWHPPLPSILYWGITHLCILATLSALMAPTPAHILHLLRGFLNPSLRDLPEAILSAGILAYAFIFSQWIASRMERFEWAERFAPALEGALYSGALILAIIASTNAGSFVYTRF